MLRKYRNCLFLAVTILIIIGIIMIYSSSYIWAEYKYNDSLKYVKQQIIFVIIGYILMKITSKINYRFYYEKANLILSICLFLMILVLIPGIGTVRNGSRSWFGIGSFGIQPSEALKLGLMIFISKYTRIQHSSISDMLLTRPWARAKSAACCKCTALGK